MLFILALLVLPVAVVLAFFLATTAWRGRHRGLALLVVVGALTAGGVLAWLGYRQATFVRPTSLDVTAIPGAWVRLGHDARDELQLAADGTFARAAVYRGVRQVQRGRWTYLRVPRGLDSIDFTDLEPSCLRSTARPGASLQWREPNEVLCIAPPGTWGGFACTAGGRLALCLGDDLEFVKQ